MENEEELARQERLEEMLAASDELRNLLENVDANGNGGAAAAAMAAAAAVEPSLASLQAAAQALNGVLRADYVHAAAESEQTTASFLAAVQGIKAVLRASAAVIVAATNDAIEEEEDEDEESENEESESEEEEVPPPPVVEPLAPEPLGDDAAEALEAAIVVDEAADDIAVIDFSGADSGMVKARSFRGAVAILLDVNDRRLIEMLTVFPRLVQGWPAAELAAFRQFVTLLGQQHENGREVREISFYGNWDGLPDDDMERLFRDVLPNHRTIQRIHISLNGIPSRLFRMLIDSIPTAGIGTSLSCLSRLSVDDLPTDPATGAQAVQAIINMLRRNTAIEELQVISPLDSDHCRQICQVVPSSTKLRTLYLAVTEVRGDTLDGLAASPSMKFLDVSGTFSANAVPSLAGQLRTNETLVYLTLNDPSGNGARDSQALLELVGTYNYSLHEVNGDLGSGNADPRVREQFREYASRNQRIRREIMKLQHPYFARRLVVDDGEELVRVLALASDVPTALYKILKMSVVIEAIGRLSDHNRRRPSIVVD